MFPLVLRRKHWSYVYLQQNVGPHACTFHYWITASTKGKLFLIGNIGTLAAIALTYKSKGTLEPISSKRSHSRRDMVPLRAGASDNSLQVLDDGDKAGHPYVAVKHSNWRIGR
ncbi:hypothetical protein GCM10007160_03580 [Litchfieldella qijiaojingensis]|uniref:Uncharacterized protein n=1 Tax=Litchfieldella qijiaojingensis TaxID=980347 RepID=A0ABQ2YC76_9GAMM|nr:hypothetical protein GCM10007160_03580 [Halomonas qijiaojingensis]